MRGRCGDINRAPGKWKKLPWKCELKLWLVRQGPINGFVDFEGSYLVTKRKQFINLRHTES